MDSDSTQRSASATFAERLRELFATIQDRDKRGRPRPFSNKAVAQAISEDPSHDTTISRTYLDGLRNGRNVNPSTATVAALVKFFNDHRAPDTPPVTASWLIGEESADDARLRQAMSDANVRAIAMRASGMNPELQEQLLDMMQILSRGSRDRTDDGATGTDSEG